MRDQWTELWFGSDFERNERKPLAVVIKMLEDGEAEEARMPRPTRRHPERTRLVYRWTGSKENVWKAAFERRGLSAQMPPCVTELAAEGIAAFVACADAWHGHVTPEFRGLRSLPVNVRLLVNAVVPA